MEMEKVMEMEMEKRIIDRKLATDKILHDIKKIVESMETFRDKKLKEICHLLDQIEYEFDFDTGPLKAKRIVNKSRVKETNRDKEENKIDSESIKDKSRHKIQVKRLSEFARLPTRGSQYAAGYDLYSAVDCIVPARGKALVSTDLSITVPYGTYGRIAPRSGLALKNSIDVGAGVCDYDYTGNYGIILFNHSDQDFVVSKGDRVAQLILEKIVQNAEMEEVQELKQQERGESGFGSTGK